MQLEQTTRLCVVCSAASADGDAGNDEPSPDVASTRRRRGEPLMSDASGTLKQQAVASNNEVSDKLIAVFQEKQLSEWRKLIAYSKQWPMLAPGLMARVEERAAAAEEASEEQLALRKLGRRLAAVNEELSLYQQVIDKFRAAPSSDWEGLVSLSRTVMGQEFFKYLDMRIKVSSDDGKEREQLLALGAQLVALTEAYDRVVEDERAMEKASESFNSLLQVDSLEQADQKIDELAASGRLDPALLLMMAKAYAGSKETDATQEDVKDIMAHLYFKAKEGFARQAPKEVRILKHLLTVEGERERAQALEQAFEQGPELEAGDVDYLCTKPADLLNTIENVLTVYDTSRRKVTMAGEASALMNPQVIEKMRVLQRQIRRQYM
ncbi:hypothetical protein D9Q98_007052 [Chlorella vulgaris]|uniref:Uncharacterized protein n=1 Tax=Chlorella vulgaris TaxID=3077 RepID=A0A9D4YUT0_CHLVU|nr:hypothetical protein D9Q98_007052 [Chlorella vulgaris]